MKRVVLAIAVLVCSTVQAWAEEPAALKVYALDCGHIIFKDMAMFNDTGQFDGQTRELSDICVLVQHPKGILLWETGLPKSARDQTMREGIAHYVTTTIQEQLAQINVKPEDITYVTVSHAHFDHSGNLRDFPKATVLLQSKEWNYINSKPAPFGVNPANFGNLKKDKLVLLKGDYDVFGDGSVRFFATPGHTPGHQSMLVKLASGNILFSGDLYHQHESYEHNYVPGFNNSRADTLASSDRVKGLLKTYNAKLIVQHDKADFESLPALPNYLE